LNVQCFLRLKEEQHEFINDANFKHGVDISRQWAATEEADTSSWRRSDKISLS
jgi:hypothetical protein